MWKAVAASVAEWRDVNRHFTGDFYPLTAYSTAADAWMAWQYDQPDRDEGLVQAFRRPESPLPAQSFRLQALDPLATYEVTNHDTGQKTDVTGRELMNEGLSITLADRPGAGLFTYRKQAGKRVEANRGPAGVAPRPPGG